MFLEHPKGLEEVGGRREICARGPSLNQCQAPGPSSGSQGRRTEARRHGPERSEGGFGFGDRAETHRGDGAVCSIPGQGHGRRASGYHQSEGEPPNDDLNDGDAEDEEANPVEATLKQI